MRGPESRQPGDLNFHYNREEREASLGDDVRNRQHLSFWGRNLHLMLIFVDILVMTAVVIFLLPHIRGRSAEAAGYSFSMNVTLFDGTILAAVKAEPGDGASDQNVEVRLGVLPEGRTTSLYDILSPEGENIIRGRIPYHAGDTDLTAVITVDGNELSLRRPIPKE